MTDRLKDVLSSSSWSFWLAFALAIATGVYGYGTLTQRVTTLEMLRPVDVATKLAEIQTNQMRTIQDLARMQADIGEIRRELGGSSSRHP